ncbi:hypothetical protein JOD43_002131 [Pullulanibacillus pueri]|nr:hypothetical protein [Pullulanibacillus pueri]
MTRWTDRLKVIDVQSQVRTLVQWLNVVDDVRWCQLVMP